VEVEANKGTKEMEAKDKLGKEKKRGKVDAVVLHCASGIPDTFVVPLSPYHFSCLTRDIFV
jgi:hypothetical protein